MQMTTVLTVVGTLLAVTSSAGTIPYPGTGTQNPATYSFTAASSGDVIAYFDGRGKATFTDTLGLMVDGVSTGITGLNNQTSTIGESLDLGRVQTGDVLDFYMTVTNFNQIFYSDPTKNPGGINHVYSTSFAGDSMIPAGTYVGFEDAIDFNYLDEQFVFTTATPSASPEPANFAPVGLTLLGLTATYVFRGRTGHTRYLRLTRLV